MSFFYLKNNYYWPFSTSSETKAFLGANFGMSPPEVNRALHMKLVGYEEYSRVVSKPLITDFLSSSTDLIDVNLKKHFKSLFVPRIDLFDASCEAEFDFLDKKLRGVYVHFQPYSQGDVNKLLNALNELLTRKYKFSNREESKDVPGAYRMYYENEFVKVDLWINLTNLKENIVVLTLLYKPYLVALRSPLKFDQ